MAGFKLLVGLGNPGSEYKNTRHNTGARWIESLARQSNCSLLFKKNFFGQFSKAYIAGKEYHLLIPTTYMNSSGKAVYAACRFYNISPENILVIHDEIDMSPGTVRMKTGGSHGGHNGLKDIIAQLSNNREFSRLRIGIGRPSDPIQVARYVLERATLEESMKIEQTIGASLRCIDDILLGNLNKVINQLHSFKA